jgi:hypothetical protein
LVQEGWDGNWDIPETAPDHTPNRWYLEEIDGEEVLITPNTPHDAPWEPGVGPTKEHAATVRKYPNGFILEIEFKFDPNQKPVFPKGREADNKHRPTFLGNSGVGIYHWPGNPDGKYLYEVQVTDTAGMCGGKRQIPHENRFMRLNYGAAWDQKGVLEAVAPALLADEQEHLDPAKLAAFNAEIADGGADCLCAIVAGLPVSIFQDVHLTCGDEEFPRPGIAVSSPIPLGANKDTSTTPLLPIGGVEDPRDMYWGHRADYLKRNGKGQYEHFNHLASDAWNKLWVCFLPARYAAGEKLLNAYLHTKINGVTVFDGEIKSGSRSSRHTDSQDPEPAVYGEPPVEGSDKKIRLLGHWGSKVFFQKVVIKSIDSEE